MSGVPFTLRRYAPGDLAAVVGLFHRAVHISAAGDYTPEQLAAWAPDPPDLATWSARLASGETLVAETEGQILGFIRVAHDDGSTALVDLLYVAPEVQRRGVATALLERAREWGRRQQLAALVADVSITARPFMERHGFSVVAEQLVERHGAALRRFRMRRPLEGGG